MISVTVDTNIFDRSEIHESKTPWSEVHFTGNIACLEQLQISGLIEIYISGYVMTEINKLKNRPEILLAIKKLAKQKDNVLRSTPILLEEDKIKIISQIKGYSQEEILDTLNKIKSVLFQEGYIGKKRNNKYNDVHILAEHILNKRDIFVTKDVNDFIGKTQNKLVALKKLFPELRIMCIEEFLNLFSSEPDV